MNDSTQTGRTPGEDALQVFDYTGEGYFPTMHSGAWRVAHLNWARRFDVSFDAAPERHLLTDEVFVLLRGRAVLEVWDAAVTEGGADVLPLCCAELEEGRIYNVRQGVFHRLTAEPGSRLLVVEDHSTNLENSRYMAQFPPKALTPELVAAAIRSGLTQ